MGREEASGTRRIGPCAPRVRLGRTAVLPARPCAAAAAAPLTGSRPASSVSACPSARPPVRDRRPPLFGEWVEAGVGIAPGYSMQGAARTRGDL